MPTRVVVLGDVVASWNAKDSEEKHSLLYRADTLVNVTYRVVGGALLPAAVTGQ